MVSVFRRVVWIACSVKSRTACTVKVEAVICREIWLLYTGQHGVISEQTSIFSSFDRNKLEYYRNILWLIILKRNFSPSNLRALMYVNNVSTNVRYLHQYLASKCTPKFSSSLGSPFATNMPYSFHFSFKPPITIQFSRHVLCNGFDYSFYIAAMFPNRPFHVLCVMSLMVYLYFYWI